jgi:nucleoside-diphosphate-sugar epimerase
MGMAHVIPELLRKAHEAPDGGSIEVYSVDHTRTFCFIDDAIDMMRAVAVAPTCNGETLNLGCQAPETAIGDLARIVVDTVGKSLNIDAKPPTAGSPARRCPDMSRMTALTGREAGTSLADGIRRTYAWYDAEVLGTAT